MKTWNLPSVVEMDINMTMSNTTYGNAEQDQVGSNGKKNINGLIHSGKIGDYYNDPSRPPLTGIGIDGPAS